MPSRPRIHAWSPAVGGVALAVGLGLNSQATFAQDAGAPAAPAPSGGGPNCPPSGHHHHGGFPRFWLLPPVYNGPYFGGGYGAPFGPYPPLFYYSNVTVGSPAPAVPPMVVPLPDANAAPADPFGVAAGADDPLAAPIRPQRRPASVLPAAVRRRGADPERAAERMTVGDRLFRAGELKRAAERYEQAIAADLGDARPYVRLAQVAIARGDYDQAADHFREAQLAEPGWLLNADDIQNLFGGPDDFGRVIAALESHLQAEPTDRDAWLVLGAELYLTGRTRPAADVFLRLTDRKPDDTLQAFLDASRARE